MIAFIAAQEGMPKADVGKRMLSTLYNNAAKEYVPNNTYYSPELGVIYCRAWTLNAMYLVSFYPDGRIARSAYKIPINVHTAIRHEFTTRNECNAFYAQTGARNE